MRIAFPDGVRRQASATLALASALLLFVAGCSSGNFESELDSVRSWTATARLAAEERNSGSTNRAVTAQVRDRAAAARQTAEDKLARLARSDAERATAVAALDSMARAIALLERAAR